MSTPFLPLFVFDGPKRPKVKRGKRISGKDHWMVQGMQKIIDAFGFEWRTAPGEAEAELAYLNRIGVIDAVLSDDVDTFLFGATMVVRNPSATLSGNKAHPVTNTAGKVDDNHVVTYTSKDFGEDPKISLNQEGLILIGVLRGGDYHQGVNGCGVTTAHGLARCGFGDTLVKSARTMTEEELEDFLVGWREDIRKELRTNSKGFLGRKCPSLAKALPEDFPDIDVLLSYTNPITSETYGKTPKDFKIDWEKEPNLGKIAGLCETYFEWGIKDIIIKRFRTVIWPPAVLRILRRSALLADKRFHKDEQALIGGVPSTPRKPGGKELIAFGTPSKMIARHFSTLKLDSPTGRQGADSDTDGDGDEDNLIKKIHSSRTHTLTDGLLEYRLEIAPAQLIRLCEAGIRGDRKPAENNMDEFDSGDDEDGEEGSKTKAGPKKPPPEPTSHLRVWMPACMVKLAEPRLVEEFEAVQQAKLNKKAGKANASKAKATKAGPSKTSVKVKDSLATLELSDASDEDIPVPGPSKPKSRPKLKTASTDISQIKDLTTKTQRKRDTGAAGPSTIDDFFKASKLPTKPVTVKAKTKTAAVGSLFKNFDPPPTDRHSPNPFISEGTDEDTDVFGSLLSKGAQTNKSKSSRSQPPPIRSKSNSVLSLFNQNSIEDKSRSQSQPVLERAQARPFPMPFDPPATERQETTKSDLNIRPTLPDSSPRRQRPSDSSEPDVYTAATQKSPRKSHARRSPHSTRHVSYSSADEEGQPRPSSPSPYRPTALPVLPRMPKPKVTGIKYHAEIIEISSDSDGPSSLVSKQPPIRSLGPRARKTAKPSEKQKAKDRPIPSTTDVIDLT
ncbi:unnamed protein product [Somion occarium]